MANLLYNPSNVPPPVGGYSQGLEVSKNSRLLFISGQIPEKLAGEVPETFVEQCELVWDNIEAVLKSAGMKVAHLVKVTTFLTEANQVTINREVRQRHLGEVRPALTVVIAQTLESKWLLEIEAIAASDE